MHNINWKKEKKPTKKCSPRRGCVQMMLCCYLFISNAHQHHFHRTLLGLYSGFFWGKNNMHAGHNFWKLLHLLDAHARAFRQEIIYANVKSENGQLLIAIARCIFTWRSFELRAHCTLDKGSAHGLVLSPEEMHVWQVPPNKVKGEAMQEGEQGPAVAVLNVYI